MIILSGLLAIMEAKQFQDGSIIHLDLFGVYVTSKDLLHIYMCICRRVKIPIYLSIQHFHALAKTCHNTTKP